MINMPARIILLIIFLPACVALFFSLIQKTGIKVSNKMSDENFTVSIPSTVVVIGAMCAVMSLAVLLGFTYLSDESPHFIFYLVFGLLFWLGTYLIVKALTFKVIVKQEEITAFSAFRKPYSFAFSEIVSAVRQVKKNQKKSERIVIKTATGKRLVIESSEISYKRFAKKNSIRSQKGILGWI